MFPIRRQAQAGSNVFGAQFREILQDFLRRHPGRQILQHVINRDPQAPETRLAAPLAGFDSNLPKSHFNQVAP